jgi:hypothetical protein
MGATEDDQEFQQARRLADAHGFILFRIQSGIYQIVPRNNRRRWSAVQYQSGQPPIALGDAWIKPGNDNPKSLFEFTEWFLRQKGKDLGRLSKRQQLLKIFSQE